MNKYDEAVRLLEEAAGNKDGLICLSTIAADEGNQGKPRPASRIIDAYYKDGAFYAVTHAKSDKMLEIEQNPKVAVCVIAETFKCEGYGENLGWVCDEKNAEMMSVLRTIFAAWYYDANDESDPETCLLRICLTRGLWNDFHKKIRYEINFINKTAW